MDGNDADGTLKVSSVKRRRRDLTTIVVGSVRSVRGSLSAGKGASSIAPIPHATINGNGIPPTPKKRKVKAMIEFFWEGFPPKSTFQQRDKNFHKTPAARLAFAQWRAILEQGVPAHPLQGALSFKLVLTWPFPKSMKTTSVVIPKTTRPDGVNILKGVEDIMTKLGYWQDDNQLAIETVERWYGMFPGVLVQIQELGEVRHD